MVRFETNLGGFTLELDADKAPVSVANFLKYVDEGFFDGLIFHRVIPGFMIQGGGMTPDMAQKKNQRADQERGHQRAEEPARHARDGAHERHQQRDLAVLHQPHRTTASSTTRRATTATRCSARSSTGIDTIDRIAKERTGRRKGHDDVPVDRRGHPVGEAGRARRLMPRPKLPGELLARLRRVLRGLGLALAGLVLLSFLAVLGLRVLPPLTTAFIVEARVASWFDDDQRPWHLRREWRDLAQISPQLQLAVIAAEDQRFPEHTGFDFKQIQKALRRGRQRRSRARRQHDHAAGREEPVPLAGPQLRCARDSKPGSRC